MKATRVVAYLRVSTGDQALGLAVQRAEIERWATSRGVTVAAWFEDRVSGGSSIEKRPALLAALAALGRGDTLVVQKRDRLARDVGLAISIESLVRRAKATLASAHGEGEGGDPMSYAMLRIADVFAEVERLQIGARTQAALAAKRARGECTGTVPFGFRRAGPTALAPNADEQAVISAVRAFRAAGLSYRAIVSELAAAGHLGRTGKPFALAQVHAMAAA